MSESQVDYKALYEAQLQEIAVLKAELAATPPKNSYIYYIFNPWTMKSIYAGKGIISFLCDCRENQHFTNSAGSNKKIGDAIKQAVEQGGVGFVRLLSSLHSHEAAGAESALIAYLKLEGYAVNERNESRQGSYADMNLRELQEAGRQMVEEGLKKWREDGRKVYVKQVKPNSPPNVKPFSDYLNSYKVMKVCRSSECKHSDRLVEVNTAGFCRYCRDIVFSKQCPVIELGKRCESLIKANGLCGLHNDRQYRANKANKEVADYSVDFIQSTKAKCGDCEQKFERNSVCVKHGKRFYHPRCLADIHVPDIPAFEFQEYDDLTESQQIDLDILFPGNLLDDEIERVDPDLDKPVEERLDMLRQYFVNAKESDSIGDGTQLLNEAERLELKSKAPLLLAQVLFTKDILNGLNSYHDLILRFCHKDKKAQQYLIGGFEQFLEKNPDFLPQAPEILKAICDTGLCTEDVVFSWAGRTKPSSKFVKKDTAREIIKSCESSFNWLKVFEEDKKPSRKRDNENDSDDDLPAIPAKKPHANFDETDTHVNFDSIQPHANFNASDQVALDSIQQPANIDDVNSNSKSSRKRKIQNGHETEAQLFGNV